jgi:hypothetical protein
MREELEAGARFEPVEGMLNGASGPFGLQPGYQKPRFC